MITKRKLNRIKKLLNMIQSIEYDFLFMDDNLTTPPSIRSEILEAARLGKSDLKESAKGVIESAASATIRVSELGAITYLHQEFKKEGEI